MQSTEITKAHGCHCESRHQDVRQAGIVGFIALQSKVRHPRWQCMTAMPYVLCVLCVLCVRGLFYGISDIVRGMGSLTLESKNIPSQMTSNTPWPWPWPWPWPRHSDAKILSTCNKTMKHSHLGHCPQHGHKLSLFYSSVTGSLRKKLNLNLKR
jgi:hypothetical protein